MLFKFFKELTAVFTCFPYLEIPKILSSNPLRRLRSSDYDLENHFRNPPAILKIISEAACDK
jgi:hypothetical protein